MPPVATEKLDEGIFVRIARVVGAWAGLVQRVVSNVDRLVNDAIADSAAVTRDAQALYAQASAHAATVHETLRATPRFTRILTEVVRIVASYRLHEKKALFVKKETADAALERLHAENAERVYRLCVELRGAVLKVGQFVSTRVDLLPRAYIERLSLLQDRVPPIPYEEVVTSVRAELGKTLEETFARVDAEPLATASLAQVHGASLTCGADVVLKVQLPGIEELVEIDLAALRVLANTLGGVFPQVDLVTFATELTRAVREELDFENEAANAAEFAAAVASDSAVVVPRVHRELSTKRLLTLERLRGERLVDFLDACERRGEEGARDRDRILETLVRTTASQILQHGLFHADPHPGNFLVLSPAPQSAGPLARFAPTGASCPPQSSEDAGVRLAIFDFGCVMRFPHELRRAYATLAVTIVAGDAEEITRRLREIGFETDDDDALREAALLLLEVLRTGATLDRAAFDPAAQIARAIEIARRNPKIRVPAHFVLLGRVLASLGGLLVRYRPRVDLWSLLLPYLARQE